MKVKELIEQLKKVDENKEVRIANNNIADTNGNMPTFEVLEAGMCKGMCLISFDDDIYIDEIYSLSGPF